MHEQAATDGQGGIRMIDCNELEFQRHVGAGGTSQISLHKWTTRGASRLVVKKTLFRGSVISKDQALLKQEMSILTQLRHQHIIQIFGIVHASFDYGLVMEFCRHGSYRQFFSKIRQLDQRMENLDNLVAPLKIQIVIEVVCAMKYIHSKRILHLDLKTDNILLDDDLHVKICDFGLSQMQVLTQLRTRSSVAPGSGKQFGGTPGYLPPERLRNFNVPPSTKSDVFSFGVLMWEVLTDKAPYADLGFGGNVILLGQHIVFNDLRPGITDVSDVFPSALTRIMVRAWSDDVDERPSFADLELEMRSVVCNYTEFHSGVQNCQRKILSIYKSVYGTENFSSVAPVDCNCEKSDSNTRGHDQVPRAESVTVAKYHSEDQSANSWDGCVERVIQLREQQNAIPDSEITPLIGVMKKRVVSPGKIVAAISATFALLAVVLVTTLLTVNSKVCPALNAPSNGTMKCWKGSTNVSTKCIFTCDEGYGLIGSHESVCIAGKWSENPPRCGRVCHTPLVPHGKVDCSNGTFTTSVCNITCLGKRVIEGSSSLTCHRNGTWSDKLPNCTCPECSIGNECEYSTSWIDVRKQISHSWISSSTITYGGHLFTCDSGIFAFDKYHCRCHDDEKTDYDRNCEGYESASGACEHAAAQLIRDLVAKNIYPRPCDPAEMTQNC